MRRGATPALGPISLGIAAADFNRDGLVDLAIPSTVIDHGPPHPSSVGVYLQQSSGASRLGAPAFYAVGFDTTNTIAADVNGDGLPDVVTVDYGANTLSILLNDPKQPGQFLPALVLASGPFPQQVVAADVNGDGYADLLEAYSGGVAIHSQNAASPGTFAAATMIPIDQCCDSVAVADLNGDGLPDMAVVQGGGTLSILFQDPTARGSFKPPVQLGLGVAGRNIVIADLNGDGANDLVYAGPLSATGVSAAVVVALQDPTNPGHFLAPTTYATAVDDNEILVRDLNGDGLPDLLVGTSTGLSILFQDASHPGRFLPARTYAPFFVDSAGDQIPYDFSYIDLADMNGDGLLDIVVSTGPSYNGPGVLFQVAGSPGTFGPYQDLH